jgi:hypothetical protein
MYVIPPFEKKTAKDKYVSVIPMATLLTTPQP